jgi:two-component system NtrC family response regulator
VVEQPTILIVDDEAEVIKFFSYLLEEKPYQLLFAQTGKKALELITKQKFDTALVDLKLPDTDGITILGKIREAHPECQVIIMTGFSTIKSAVQAIQLGAFDYINKPFEDINELESLIAKAVTKSKGRLTGKKDWEKVCEELGIIVGASKKMMETFSLAAKIAPKNLSVLITGETGTGKELMARFVHQCSGRKDKPFFAINCGAVAESLLESELFGHEKGAFTGAGQQRRGIFQLADQGTLFLDEVGESSQGIQVKLLRALETGEFIPVGGEKKLASDVRIVAATNMDLEQAVKEHQFRQDLFFRLDVVRLHLPALRERKEDLPLLVESLLTKKLRDQGRETKGAALKTMLMLKEYPWPGNVRELVNVIDQAIALADGNLILPKHLPEKLRTHQLGDKFPKKLSLQELAKKLDQYSDKELRAIYEEISALGRTIEKKLPYLKSLSPHLTLVEMEQKLITDTLQRCSGNISVSANMLGIGRNTLYRKMEKLNLGSPTGNESDY